MKLCTLCFLIAEMLDLLTTGAGLLIGAMELNRFLPLGVLVVVKVVVVAVVACVLECKRTSKLDWIIVVVASVPVAWNGLNILAEIV